MLNGDKRDQPPGWSHSLQILTGKLFQIAPSEVPRVLFHGIILACIIAAFWLMDALKDPVFAATVGLEHQPKAKLLSVITTLCIVCAYDFLTSMVTKPTLFYIVSTLFGCMMLLLSVLLADGLVEERYLSHKIIGWTAYFAIEAYGSLMTALFWSFTNCTMDLNEAKGAFGLIIATAQIGAIIGSTLATSADKFGIGGLFLSASFLVFGVSLLIQSYHRIYHHYLLQLSAVHEDADLDHPVPHTRTLTKSNPLWGFCEGLGLIFRYFYVFKILCVACLYEIVMTIMDYEFKLIASQKVQHGHAMDRHAEGRFANILGHFGQLSNLVSLVISLFGFSFLVHRFGVHRALLIFPFTLLIAVVTVNSTPTLQMYFIFVSILKGMICSLNDPVKELLYMPTSEAIKFKAKAWIDVFGSRLAKAAGSSVTYVAAGNLSVLHRMGRMPCFLIAALIIGVSWATGNEFMELVNTDTIVGEENHHGAKNSKEQTDALLWTAAEKDAEEANVEQL